MANFSSNEVINFVNNNIKRNTFGVVLTTATVPTMRKTNNPYVGRVTKITKSVNVAFGRDYAEKVNKELAERGLQADFKAAKASGKVRYDDFFDVSDDGSKFYLRVMFNANSKSEVSYLVDGRLATAAEVGEIKAFMPSSAPSAKQMAHGLTSAETIKFVGYLTDNIVSIQQGDRVLK